MRKGLEEAFDECLARLKRGESLDACLQHYPQDRDELASLLQLAVALQDKYQAAKLAPQASSRGRAAFLGEAVQFQEQTRQVGRAKTWWSSLRFAGVSRTLGTMALTLVFLLVALTGGNMVSANSLPGDALYGVKRASEQVRYLLTLDEVNRSQLQQVYAERRVQEIRQVLDEQRVTEVAFAGVVETMRGDTITISGIAIQLAGDMVKNRPEIGASVEIVGQTQADGRLSAKEVRLVAPAPPTPVPPTATPLPATATAPAFVKPTGVPTLMPSETPKPSATFTEEPTALPSVTPSSTSTLKASPTASETPLPTVTSTNTPSPTATAPPPPREVTVRIEGRIDEIGSSHWTVSGQRVGLGTSTKIKQDAALAQVGGWAVVRAIKKTDGSLQAQEIEVLRGPDAEPQPVEFSGVIEAFGADRWTISGKVVEITSQTMIDGTPQVGAQAHVIAQRYPDGRLVAERITVVAAEEVVQFEGIVEAIGQETWRVAGQEIQIDSNTQIEGTPVVGAIAEVEAVVRADGSKLARRIVIIWSPAVEPTETATPSVSPAALLTAEALQPTHAPALPTQTPGAPAAEEGEATPTDGPVVLNVTPEPTELVVTSTSPQPAEEPVLTPVLQSLLPTETR